MLAYKFDMGRGMDRQPILIQDFQHMNAWILWEEVMLKSSAYKQGKCHIYRQDAIEESSGEVFTCIGIKIREINARNY